MGDYDALKAEAERAEGGPEDYDEMDEWMEACERIREETLADPSVRAVVIGANAAYSLLHLALMALEPLQQPVGELQGAERAALREVRPDDEMPWKRSWDQGVLSGSVVDMAEGVDLAYTSVVAAMSGLVDLAELRDRVSPPIQ